MATASRRRFPALLSRRNGASAAEAIHGTARLGRRTKHLVKRLGPGDVAVIDHVNIDRIAAEELIETGVRAVLNASESSNGRYPNAGPLMLARAGICLIDAAGGDLFELLRDGDPVTIEGGTVRVGGQEVLNGRVLGVARAGAPARRPARAGRRGAGRLRREHRRPRPPGDRPADRQRRVPGDPRLLPRPPRADRRPRRPPPPRPQGPARLHPRRPPDDRRGRRRRRRGAGGGDEARHDPRRHGLGRATRRCAAGPSWSSTPTPTAARPGASACWGWGSSTRSSPPPGPARTSRC